MMHLTGAIWVTILTAGLACSVHQHTIGSGDGGSGGTCSGAFVPCGGNVVGTWTLSSVCTSDSQSGFNGCQSATIDVSGIEFSSTMTFNADMTYSSSTMASGMSIATIPAACLVQQGVTETCAQYQQALAAEPSTAGATCTGSNSCTCTIPAPDTTGMEMGTYVTTAAGVLTLTRMLGGFSDMTSEDYCVDGNRLTVSPQGSSAMMGSSAVGTIVFTKI
jgi:hypothetical protein